MKIVCNDVDLIIYIGEDVTKDIHGNIVEGNTVIMGSFKHYEVDSLPADIKPMKYCYNDIDGFYVSPSYRETEVEILEKKLADQEQAIVELSMIVGSLM